MRLDCPAPCHMDQQRALWQTAFGDPDWFLDSFFRTAYSPDRCRCILEGDQITAILYWIDCSAEDRKFAYIYAVVTHPDHRGKGLCRTLMADTHALLRARGYDGAILVPQKESLRKMYAAMGYENAGGITCFNAEAGSTALPLRAVGPAEFAALRRELLPENSVIQEGDGLRFLAEQLRFYAGDGLLLAAYRENSQLFAMELLGDPSEAPGILKALDCPRGTFRVPGTGTDFAMFHPLNASAVPPAYFGFAFD